MQFFEGSEISLSPPTLAVSGNNAHMMYVFNRNGVCLLYGEWNRPLHTLNAQQDHKLMFGLHFSLKSLTAKMYPTRSDLFNTTLDQCVRSIACVGRYIPASESCLASYIHAKCMTGIS